MHEFRGTGTIEGFAIAIDAGVLWSHKGHTL